MKCQKCGKQAVVHLTEVVSDGPPGVTVEGDAREGTKAVEIHLCMPHAIESGLMIPSEQIPLPYPISPVFPKAPKKSKKVEASTGSSQAEEQLLAEVKKAIVPLVAEPVELTVVPPAVPAPLVAPVTCPLCGMTWSGFKKSGLMGCGHDYEMFHEKLLPLIQRSQEGSTRHVGKVPPSRKGSASERHIVLLRLQHELQRAVETEHFEEAARLRDRLKQMDQA